MKTIIISILYFISINCVAQRKISCDEIENNSEQYIYGKSLGKTESEANKNAYQQLLAGLSSNVKSESTQKVEQTSTKKIESYGDKSNSQKTIDITTTNTSNIEIISNFKIEGVKYVNCKIPKSRNKNENNSIISIAYIDKEEFLKTTQRIKNTISEYIILFEEQKLYGINRLELSYFAYLYTFLSPYNLPGKIDGREVEDVRAVLYNKLNDHLTNLKINCQKAQRHQYYPDSQLSLELKVLGQDNGLLYLLNCPSINASTQLTKIGDEVNIFDIITTPSTASEEFKCEISISAASLPDGISEIAKNVKLSREIKFTANMRPVIGLDFSTVNEGPNVRLIPKIKHLSVRNMEWFINGVQISDQQLPLIPVTKINGPITLKINYDDSLSITKTIASVATHVKEDNSAIQEAPKPNTSIKPDALSAADHGFASIETFEELQLKLKDLKHKGKGIMGKKEIFANPENCWVFLVDPETKNVKYCLSPDKAGRIDIRSNTKYDTFENQLKGLIAVWVEVY